MKEALLARKAHKEGSVHVSRGVQQKSRNWERDSEKGDRRGSYSRTRDSLLSKDAILIKKSRRLREVHDLRKGGAERRK